MAKRVAVFSPLRALLSDQKRLAARFCEIIRGRLANIEVDHARVTTSDQGLAHRTPLRRNAAGGSSGLSSRSGPERIIPTKVVSDPPPVNGAFCPEPSIPKVACRARAGTHLDRRLGFASRLGWRAPILIK